ncbi:hypothetical protein N9Z47_03675 [bacterium]|nr:hypothetical protein [bacterium]
MPSSTSSFNIEPPCLPFCKLLLLTAFLFLLGLASLEWYVRHIGYQYSLKGIGNSELWGYHRARIDREDTSHQVVTVGDSKMEMGFWSSTFEQEVPGSEVVMLAVKGSPSIVVLEDIAENTEFRGLVICSASVDPTIKRDKTLQLEWLEAYRRKYSNPGWINFRFNTYLNIKLHEYYFASQINLKSFLELLWGLVDPHKSNTPPYLRKLTDRSRQADYRGLMSPEEKERMQKAITTRYESAIEKYDPEDETLGARQDEYLSGMQRVWQLAKKIEDRGGQVVIVHFPTSGFAWELEEIARPKALFWDLAAEQSPISMIHFLDICASQDFDCPDETHLNYDDAERFTRLIAGELKKRGIRSRFQSGSGAIDK